MNANVKSLKVKAAPATISWREIRGTTIGALNLPKTHYTLLSNPNLRENEINI